MGPLRDLGLVLAVLSVSATAHEPAELPVAQQALLITKVLAYDRALPSRSPGDVLILIPYDERKEHAQDHAQAFVDELRHLSEHRSVQGQRLRARAVAMTDDNRLADIESAAAIYLQSPLGDRLPPLLKAASEHDVLTLTDVEENVDAGAAIGMLRLEGRPTIVVNLGTATAEGAELDVTLLRLAVVRP